jgi:hypothetical protein
MRQVTVSATVQLKIYSGSPGTVQLIADVSGYILSPPG